MKKLVLSISVIIIIIIPSCQQKMDTNREKEAILHVLLDEGERFAAYDMEGVAALHIQDETAVRLAGPENLLQGWNDIKTLYEGYIKRNKEMNEKNPVENVRNLKENVITKVTGKTAWSVCDNVWKWEEGGETVGYTNRQITFLEQVKGNWKISFIAFIPLPETTENDVEEE